MDEKIVLEYGNANIALSRRHEGSRFRLAKVLDKARSGQKIKVAVLGGSGELSGQLELLRSIEIAHLGPRRRDRTSPRWQADPRALAVSTGHGAIDGRPFQYDAIEEKWWTFVRSWLFEAFSEEQIQFVDAARPAVDSSFFSWCWTSDVSVAVHVLVLALS